MKKIIFITIWMLTASILCWGQSKILINGVEKKVDTLEYKQIGPGINYAKLNFPEYPIDVYMLTVDLSDDNNKIETFQAQDKVRKTEAMTKAYTRLTTESKRALAGINGNFWIVSGQGYDDLLGIPHSGSIINGTMVTDPNDWNRGHGSIGFAVIDDTRKMHIDDMTFDGKAIIQGVGEYPISEINRKRKDNELVFFNEYAGTTNSDGNGTEVFVKPLPNQLWSVNNNVICEVVKVVTDKGNNVIAAGESVLSGHGTAKQFLDNLSAGQQITLNMGVEIISNNLRPAITQMLTGNALVMKDGILTDRNYNESYNSTLYPRTGIGMSQDGKKAFLIVIDKMGTSKGANTETMCGILKSAGAWNATSMDGGGSAQMMMKGEIINRPADGKERAVANGWMLFSTAPKDENISRIEFADYKINLPAYSSVQPLFYAYNQYGELINDNLEGVILSCDESLGSISPDGKMFHAAPQAASGMLTASFNGISTSKNVNIEDAAIKIKLTSVLIDNKVSYPVEIIATSGGNQYPIDPSVLSWIVKDPNICKVENGVLTGLENGETEITGTLADFSGKLKVKVEICDDRYYLQEDFSDLSSFKIKPSPNLLNFSTLNSPEASGSMTKVSYKYTPDSYSTIDFEKNIQLYSLSDTIILSMNTGNVPFNRVALYLKQNNQTARRAVNFNNPETGKDVQLKVLVKDFLNDPKDISSYPILLSKITFYPNDDTHVNNADYSFYIKDLKLGFVRDITGIEKEYADTNENLRVYPNPLKKGQDLMVALNDDGTKAEIEIRIYSLNGTLLKLQKENAQEEIIVKTSELPAGNYIISLQQGSKTQSAKIIIN